MRLRDTFHCLPGQGRAAKMWFIPAYKGAGPRSRTVKIRSHACWTGRGLHMSRNTVLDCKNIHVEASSSSGLAPVPSKGNCKDSKRTQKACALVCYRVNSHPFTLFHLERPRWFHFVPLLPDVGQNYPLPSCFRTAMVEMPPPMDTMHTKKIVFV